MSTAPKIAPPPIPAAVIEPEGYPLARLMAAAGYGHEDIVVKAKVSPLYAQFVVSTLGGKK